MDQDRTPVLEAIEQYRHGDEYTFALPGHRFGRGIDERTAAVLGGAFAADVITAKQAVSEAEELMAEAVGARQAVFTTCGSSISIHTAMLASPVPAGRFSSTATCTSRWSPR
jgi:arginine decarboxylase